MEGRLQTRQWDDDRGTRHWKTEVVATSVEMLSGRRKRDYEAESLAGQATAAGVGVDETSGDSIEPQAPQEPSTASDDDEEIAEDEQVLVLA